MKMHLKIVLLSVKLVFLKAGPNYLLWPHAIKLLLFRKKILFFLDIEIYLFRLKAKKPPGPRLGWLYFWKMNFAGYSIEFDIFLDSPPPDSIKYGFNAEKLHKVHFIV